MCAQSDIYEKARTRILRELSISEKRPKWQGEMTATQLEQVQAHADRYGHSLQEVVDAVIQNEVAFRFILGRNPSRMSYWEAALVDFLNTLPCVARAIQLPKNGKQRLYIVDGELVSQKPDSLHIKSLDLKVEFRNGAVAYIIHKFTAEAGGAQDNQWREANAALEQLRQKTTRRSKINLVAVLDGAYYIQPRRTSNGKTRIMETQEAHPYAIVCTYQEFSEATRAIWDEPIGQGAD